MKLRFVLEQSEENRIKSFLNYRRFAIASAETVSHCMGERAGGTESDPYSSTSWQTGWWENELWSGYANRKVGKQALRPYLINFDATGSPCHELTSWDNSSSMSI